MKKVLETIDLEATAAGADYRVAAVAAAMAEWERSARALEVAEALLQTSEDSAAFKSYEAALAAEAEALAFLTSAERRHGVVMGNSPNLEIG